MKKFFKKNRLALLIFLFLFIIPFFWHKSGEVDYGGDASRLYFYNPIVWLKNIALYFVSSLMTLGEAMPNFCLVPFLLFLSLTKKLLFDSPFYLNNFFNGLLLSGGFFLVYLIVEELLARTNDKRNLVAIISGLFFILSPLLIFQWERALYGFNQVLVYPLVFFLFLKYLNTGKLKFIIYMSLVCLVFSLNFSYPSLPWLFAFLPFAFVFLFFYSHFNQQKLRFLKGIVIFLLLSLLINSFDILPQIYSLLNPSQQMAMDRASMGNTGLSYFLSVQPYVRLTYNLLAQDQYVITSGYDHPLKKLIYDFGIKFLPLFFTYPILLVLGLILSKKRFSRNQLKVFDLLKVVFLILLFFMTSGVTNLGLSFYKMLFRFSWFSMFRSFYSKFAMVYIFYYSLLLGFSLTTILENISSLRKKKILVLFLAILILFNGWPLISGKIANTTLWRSANVPISTQINPDYETFLNRLKEEKSNFRILSLPLTSENYQLLQGKNGGAYFGPSSIAVLAGKNSINGITGFSTFWPSVKKMITERRYSELNKLFGLLNIGYVFHNEDDYIYDSFPDYPYSGWLKSVFPDQNRIKEFVSNLDIEKIFSVSTYNLYKRKNLLPLFYIPKKIVSTNSDNSILSEIFSDSRFEERTAIFFLNGSSKFEEGEQEKILENSEVFIKAEPQGLDFLEMKSKTETKEVSYPFVHDRSKIIWKLALVGEEYEEWSLRKNLPGLIRQKIFFANKRVNEVVSFKKYIDEKFKIYSEKLSQITNLLEKIEDKDKKTELAYEFINNIENNLTRLKTAKVIDYSNWEQVINSSIKHAQRFLPDFKINERQYRLNILKSGTYLIYTKDETLGLVGSNYSVQIGERNISKLNGSELYQGALMLWGKVVLEKGVSNLKISIKSNPNLFEENEWRESSSSTQKKYLFKELSCFGPGYWYQISGRLADDKRVKIILAEKQGNIADGQRRLSDLPEYRILKETVLNQDQREFAWFVGSSSVLDTVKIFVYDEGSGNLEKEKAAKTLESFKAVNVFAPNITLKQINGQSGYGNMIPKISFEKVNPTKFRLKIMGAKEPYYLVMNGSFSDGWRLYRNVKLKEERGDKVASYFDGEITEGKPSNVFFDKSTFETWGKKPIADNKHYSVNGYANSWLISLDDTDGERDYELTVEFYPQRFFYIGVGICAVVLFFVLYFLLKSNG